MEVTARIPVTWGQTIAVADSGVWVLRSEMAEEDEQDPNTILRIDPVSNAIVTTLDDMEHAIGSGWSITTAPDGIWIATPNGSSPPGGFDVGSEPQPNIRNVFRKGRPSRADLLRDGISGGLIRLDPQRGHVDRVLLFTDWSPDSLVRTEAGLWMTVGGSDGSFLVLFDPSKGAVLTLQRDRYFQLSASAETLWGCGEQGVEKLDTHSGDVLLSIDIRADDCEATSSALWVATGDEVVRLDPASGRIKARISIPGGVNEIAADEEHVITSAWHGSVISHVSVTNNQLSAPLEVSDSPPSDVVSSIAIGFGSGWVIRSDQVLRLSFEAG